jgi:hypothetical protein
MIEEKIIENIPKLLAEKNLNFLIGSGASVPFFPTLGNIEGLLTSSTLSEPTKQLIYALYFNSIIRKNINLLCQEKENEGEEVLKHYKDFIDMLLQKMQLRNSRISPNRVNIFTTNYDLFFEISIDTKLQENQHLFFNDGSSGYFTRLLSSDNYHKTVSMNGVFDNYQNEIPMINLIKCHGSVSWAKHSENIIKVSHDLTNLLKCAEKFDELIISQDEQVKLEGYLINWDLESLEKVAVDRSQKLKGFYEEYKNLLIINPEKTKFHHTVLNEYYYSMLRLLSYELERDQTILLVFGFSFADEHISRLILRSLNNPFLQVYIFCFSGGAEQSIKKNLGIDDKVSNIHFISPGESDSKIDFNHFNSLIFGGKKC